MSETDEERRERIEQIAARKRFNMKSLGRQVDANRLTGVARPAVPDSELPHRSDRGAVNQVDDHVGEEVAVEDVEEVDSTSLEAVEELDSTTLEDAVDDATADSSDVVEEDETDGSETEVAVAIDDESVSGAAAGSVTEPVAEAAAEVEVDDVDTEPSVPADPPEFSRQEAIDFSEASGEPDGHRIESAVRTRPRRDTVDRSEMGTQVTRSGLAGRLSDPVYESIGATANAREARLARRMLDNETQPGGRISNPREVPGIVLELAKDLPASVAVSVVRIDEEVELVGNTVDPNFETESFSQVFSSVFKSLQSASGAFRDGPFGQVRDVVIEGDALDLILRPLGDDHYLMVLEDRTSPEADLVVTRRRMSMLAPGLAAILAQQDGKA